MIDRGAAALVCTAAMPLSYAIQDALMHGRLGWMVLLYIVMIAMIAGYFTAEYDLRHRNTAKPRAWPGARRDHR